MLTWLLNLDFAGGSAAPVLTQPVLLEGEIRPRYDTEIEIRPRYTIEIEKQP